MKRDTLRLIVTAMFAFGALVLYQRWTEFEKARESDLPGAATPTTSVPQQSGSAAQDVPAAAADSEELPQITQPIQAGGDSEAPELLDAAPDAGAPAPSVAASIENAVVRAGVDQQGSIISLELLNHLRELDGPPLALLVDDGRNKQVFQSGIIGEGLPSHRDEGWRLASVDGDSRTVTSVWETPDWSVTRQLALSEDSYLAEVTYTVVNNTDQAAALHAYFQFLRDSNPPVTYSALVPSFYGAAIYTQQGKYAKYNFDELDDDYPARARDGWIGFVERYFLAAVLDGGGERENYMRQLSNGDIRVGVIRPLGQIAAGATATLQQPLYIGALENSQLDGIGPEIAEGIELAIDYGFLKVLCAPLFWVLNALHDLLGNWGLAIIVITLLIKLLFFPLSAKSYRSMARMKRLAPLMKRIKERTGDDREAMQRETMELYRKEKINPFSGCLPILVQIPVFIALYWMLLEAVELRLAPFGLWLQDLSTPDPYFVLPVLLGAAMFGQFKLNPAPPDPTQAMIMKIMPIGFAAFSILFPSGLVLYWIVNTLLSIAQQWHITRSIGQPSDKQS